MHKSGTTQETTSKHHWHSLQMKILKEKTIRKLILHQTALTAPQPTNCCLFGATALLWSWSGTSELARTTMRRIQLLEGLTTQTHLLSTLQCLGKCHVQAEWPCQECKLRNCEIGLGTYICITIRKYKFLGMIFKYFIPMCNRKYTLTAGGYLKISHLNAVTMGKLYQTGT